VPSEPIAQRALGTFASPPQAPRAYVRPLKSGGCCGDALWGPRTLVGIASWERRNRGSSRRPARVLAGKRVARVAAQQALEFLVGRGPTVRPRPLLGGTLEEGAAGPLVDLSEASGSLLIVHAGDRRTPGSMTRLLGGVPGTTLAELLKEGMAV